MLDGDEETMSDEESVPMSGQGAASTKQSWANRLPPSLMQSKGGSPIKTPTGSPSKSPAKSPGSSSSDTSPAKVCVHDTCCTRPTKVCGCVICSYTGIRPTKVCGCVICGTCQFLHRHQAHGGLWMCDLRYMSVLTQASGPRRFVDV